MSMETIETIVIESDSEPDQTDDAAMEIETSQDDIVPKNNLT